ncbi:MAG: DUF4386 domain-containing protein [Ginsengibacter sp.]
MERLIMIKEKGISMRTAALIAGIPFMLLTAPYAEFYVFPKLIKYNDAAQTTQNLLNNPKLFLSGIYAMLFTFLFDIVLAWALYIFFKPVNASLALLGAWLRVVYAVLAIAALFNFIYVLNLVGLPGIEEAYKHQQVLQLINAHRSAMNLAYIIFGIYLIFGGILIYKASYIPNVMGALVILAGASWIIHSLQPYFFKNYDLSWVKFFAIGELVFGIWLLVKGTRIKESELVV